MIVFLSVCYVLLLWILVKTGRVPNTQATWLTIIPYELILLVVLFIPMQWGAPTGKVRSLSYSVAILPNVPGEVIEVPAEPNVPLSEGDVLFKIDPTPYQAALDGLNAQLALAQTRYEQTRELVEQQAGTIFELQAYQAQIDGLRAQIDNAEFNLRETVVRAPSEGFVTNLLLRPGTRVTNLPLAPAMAFIDTSDQGLAANIHQIYVRYVKPGQSAEVTFKTRPGKIFPATVQFVVPITAQGQLPVSGAAVQPLSETPGPFVVRIALDDPQAAADIPPGALGDVAIYTSKVKMTHIIRKVMIRMTSILNYVVPA